MNTTDIVYSWQNKNGNVNTTEEILKWINELNSSLIVNIIPNKLSDSSFWFYDDDQGCITNKNNSFFTIIGLYEIKDNQVVTQQPMIIQDEIGYLGIICKEIGGVLNFLMQAKIEPGNVNKIQLSPTIQATKSNFTQKHGGNKPAYLDYFINADRHTIIVDQIQSEQSSRFYKKRNRNIIIKVDEVIEVLPSHKWMTLGQIKQLMKTNNLVNMDTRTVLSCIPFVFSKLNKQELNDIEHLFNDKALFKSMFNDNSIDKITEIYKYINDYKMFNDVLTDIVPLNKLTDWNISDTGMICKKPYSFSVLYCDIEVEGREVQKWTQPLFKAEGIATLGLFTCVQDGIRKFLVRCMPEVGCFDAIEIAPTVQLEAVSEYCNNHIDDLFIDCYSKKENVLYDVILSEEGGRFYHEQNLNIIIEIQQDIITNLPKGYFWVDYKTLNTLVQVNNCLNIQLRNLLSLLEV
ncbi:MAG: NDP-hexose 2,3-dehydratase family protein [Oscillospiraceae bacterium]